MAASIADADQTPWAPPTAFDEFRILRPLGQGGMGQVYLAHDTHLDRQVAIKFIADEQHRDDQRQRFQREARALARLSHPNVVAAYRFGEVEGRPYLVSEFIRGQSLEQLPLPLPWQRVQRIGLELARGLGAAHRGGVLHRDIKLENAILAEDGRVLLLDFGLAKLPEVPGAPPRAHGGPVSRPALPLGAIAATPDHAGEEVPGSLTRSGALMGTPMYLAPEIWLGTEASPRSDVYSLGVVLYELCAGRLPYEAATLDELYRLVTTAAPPPLAQAAPGVDPGLALVVDRCLRRDPAERYESGEALSKALLLQAARGVRRGPRRLRAPEWAGLALGLSALVAGPVYLVQRRAASLAQQAKEAQARARLPAGQEARRLYEEGLARLRLLDSGGALPVLEQAVALEPAFPLSHAALAEALLGLQDGDRAQKEAKRALELSGGLPREVRLRCEGLYYQATNELDQAVAAYRALLTLSPDNLDYGLKLAEAQVARAYGNGNERSGMKEALATLALLRKLPAPLRDDPRIDDGESWAQVDPHAAIEAAERAVRKGKALGAGQLVAEARARQVESYMELGDLDRAVAAAMEAQQLYKEGGQWFALNRLQYNVGDALGREGDLVGAARINREMVANARQMPAGAREAILVLGLHELARVQLDLAELGPAQSTIEEALALEQAESGKRGFTHQKSAFILVQVKLAQGDLGGARRLCEGALAQLTAEDPTVGDQERLTLQLNLGAVLLAQGDLAVARVRAEDAQATIARNHDMWSSIDSVHRLLSRVALAQGRLADAEAEARQELAGLLKARWRSLAAGAHARLALVLLGQGRQPEAERAIGSARELLGKGQHVAVRLAVAMAAARVRAATGQRAEIAAAQQDLAAAAEEATRLGLVGVVLEARLAQGEIEVKSGQRAPGRRDLQGLVRDAAARGYGLIAAQAAAVLR